MTVILGILGSFLAGLLIAATLIVILGRSVTRKKQTTDLAFMPIDRGTITTTSGDTISNILGGVWVFECACTGCTAAPQPHTFVCPSPTAWGHRIPRDQYCHEQTGACICGPQTELTPAGPVYLHKTVQKEPAA